MHKRLARTVLAALLTLGLLATAQAGVDRINGAGATFPYPIYAKWASAYYKATGVQLNYQSIGSGGGIKQIKAGTVDFGASDAPLKPAELDRFGLLQWPQVMGGVVPVINVPGIRPGALRLDPDVLADIFLGRITKWNDARIAALNPDLDLPDRKITVVHRSDGSGTTFIFTDYLSKVSADWKNRVGTAKAVSWPAGVGGKGNEGVASYVSRIKGAIGYVEYAYAVQNHMPYARLRNHDGNYVAPSAENFQAAAAGADWAHAKGFYLLLNDQPGAKSWPITGATFILVYKEAKSPQRTAAILKFFDWAFHHGQEMADELHYVAMPDSVVKMVEETWKREIHGPDGTPVWRDGMGQ
ncbi:MAG: phosphate ABC transporter substrate-binding protein PstS [Rhodothalassiaceae bacterium]